MEPTFRAFELMEEQTSACEHPDAGKDCCDADQPIPPSEIITPAWVNERSLLAIAALFQIDSNESELCRESPARAVTSEPLTGD